MNPLTNSTTPQVELALRDYHLPDSVSWWPLAPGWWMLLLIIIVIIVAVVIHKKTYSTRQLKKNIKLELAWHYQHFTDDNDAQLFIQQLSALLRRVSLYRFKDKLIAQLQGDEWLAFLDSSLPDCNDSQLSFSHGVGKVFLTGPYQKIVDADIPAILPVYELVTLWLNHNLKYKRGSA